MALHIRETRDRDGWREIALTDDVGDLVAVVTRPVKGAKWRLHRFGTPGNGVPYPPRKAAIAAAEQKG